MEPIAGFVAVCAVACAFLAPDIKRSGMWLAVVLVVLFYMGK